MYADKEVTSNYRWLVLGIGALAQITFAIGYAGVGVSGVTIGEAYQFTLAQVGFVLGCMGLGVALSEILWGILTDKLGDKFVLIVGLMLSGITFLFIGLRCVPYDHSCPDYRVLGGLLILAGAVGGSINSSSGRAVMSWFRDHERGFAMSIRQTAIPVGAAMGTVLFPFFAGSYGFRVSFLFLTVLYFAMAICVGIGLRTFPADKLHNVDNNDRKIRPSPFRRFSLWKLALSAGALTFPQMAVLTFASVYLTQVYHLGMLSISVLLAGIQLGGGILRIVTGRLSDTYKNRCQILCVIALMAGISSIILGVAAHGSVQVVVFLLILIGLSGNAWHGVAYTEIAVLAGVHYSGRALGMIGTTIFVASFIIPYVIPHMLSAFSWNGVWIMVGMASLAAIPLMYEFIKKVEV